eukprot:764022-Hanusia_phi.AAC.6
MRGPNGLSGAEGPDRQIHVPTRWRGRRDPVTLVEMAGWRELSIAGWLRVSLVLLLGAHTDTRLQSFVMGCEQSRLLLPELGPATAEMAEMACCCLKRTCQPLSQVEMWSIHRNSSANFLSPGPCTMCGASPMHRCAVCGTSVISSGAVTNDAEAKWLAFFCWGCSKSVANRNASIVTMRKNLKVTCCEGERL